MEREAGRVQGGSTSSPCSPHSYVEAPGGPGLLSGGPAWPGVGRPSAAAQVPARPWRGSSRLTLCSCPGQSLSVGSVSFAPTPVSHPEGLEAVRGLWLSLCVQVFKKETVWSDPGRPGLWVTTRPGVQATGPLLSLQREPPGLRGEQSWGATVGLEARAAPHVGQPLTQGPRLLLLQAVLE